MNPTHYETLGVSETATQVEIKRAYRRLARKYHPDRNKKKGAEEKFKEINSAYQVLGDPGRRQIYDYTLRQSRKAGGASGSSSAGASTPPPPPPPSPGFWSGAGAQAAPPPPPAAPIPSRYFFFFRGALAGGITVAVIVVLALVSYVACHASPAEPVRTATPPEPVSAAKTEEGPARVPVTPEPTPTAPEPTPAIPEPTPSNPGPTPEARIRPGHAQHRLVSRRNRLSTAEPTPRAPNLIRVPSPVHLCGKWRGSFEWFGTRVPFLMRLEQHGNEISGVWTETQAGRLWRATIQGQVAGSTVTFVKRYASTDSTVSFVSSDSSSGLLRGTWETPQNRGSWEAVWESEVVGSVNDHPRDDSWRLRRALPGRDRSRD